MDKTRRNSAIDQLAQKAHQIYFEFEHLSVVAKDNTDSTNIKNLVKQREELFRLATKTELLIEEMIEMEEDNA